MTVFCSHCNCLIIYSLFSMFEVLSFVRRSRFVDVEGECGGTWMNKRWQNGNLPHKLLCNFEN